MLVSRLPRRGIPVFFLVLFFLGCSQDTPSHPLDQELARASVQKAMEAWVAEKSPKDLQPEIVVGDMAWEQGEKLVSLRDPDERRDVGRLKSAHPRESAV